MEKNNINIHNKLIKKCKKGDSKAQFEIYELYYKAMYNTSLRIVKNTDAAEDIMQESFLSAFNKIDTYKENVSFGAWLKKIVINKSLDHIKKEKNFETISIDEFDNDIKDDDFKIDYEEQKKQIENIVSGISTLPDSYRVILSLYLLEGYDHEEIGEILNITSSTSRSQLTRGKRKLLETLKQA